MQDTPKSHTPRSLLITLPDPDTAPVRHHAEEKGVLEVRSDAPNYPNFELRFVGPNPFNSDVDAILDAGTAYTPIVIDLKKQGDYRFTVHHKHKDGDRCEIHTFEFSVHPCKNCW
jgi:hypothetical protein